MTTHISIAELQRTSFPDTYQVGEWLGDNCQGRFYDWDCLRTHLESSNFYPLLWNTDPADQVTKICQEKGIPVPNFPNSIMGAPDRIYALWNIQDEKWLFGAASEFPGEGNDSGET